jgi:hypothetical protein
VEFLMQTESWCYKTSLLRDANVAAFGRRVNKDVKP